MIRALLVGLFGLWRVSIGQVVPNACRFRPTCSHYAQEALIQRGLVVGLGLTTWRLLRCHPWNRGGYDPLVRSSPPCTADRDASALTPAAASASASAPVAAPGAGSRP